MTLRWCRLVIPAAAALLVLAGCGGKGSKPSISALESTPASARLPANVQSQIEGMAANVGLTPAAAIKGVRLLRPRVAGRPLYAFEGSKRRVCFLVLGGVGTCGQISAEQDILWAVSSGKGPRGRVVVGIVSDAVASLMVHIGARDVKIDPVNNSFFVSFVPLSRNSLPTISVTAVLG